MVAGNFDYLLKVRVADMAAYKTFVANVIANLPGVRETRSFAVIDEVKNTTRLQVEL
jgi:Lrp/AsnC family leucine-responsive transcriptional regulator